MSLRDTDFGSSPAEPLPPDPSFAVCTHCGRRFAMPPELSGSYAVRVSDEDPGMHEYAGTCARCQARLEALAARPRTDYTVACELVNLCERVRGHVASGMERDAAIRWVVESQMAAADAEHPNFLRYLRDKNLVVR